MKISREKKHQILLDTFDLLKSNYEDNAVELRDVIGKMSKIDLDTSVQMWKYLIKSYPSVLHTTDDFAFSVMYAIEKYRRRTDI